LNLLGEAVIFAARVHDGQKRKSSGIPYIIHPMEVAAIASKLTTDVEVLAAAVLHDTVEDTGTTPEEIKERFGPRVAELVAMETEDKMRELPASDTWKTRKEMSLEKVRNENDRGAKIVWLSDKLSNMRSFYEMYKEEGDDMWQRFHNKDISLQYWYYREIEELLREDFGQTDQYKELTSLMRIVFSTVISKDKEDVNND